MFIRRPMFIAIFNKMSPCFVQYQTSNIVASRKLFLGKDIACDATEKRVMKVYSVPRRLKGLGSVVSSPCSGVCCGGPATKDFLDVFCVLLSHSTRVLVHCGSPLSGIITPKTYNSKTRSFTCNHLPLLSTFLQCNFRLTSTSVSSTAKV